MGRTLKIALIIIFILLGLTMVFCSEVRDITIQNRTQLAEHVSETKKQENGDGTHNRRETPFDIVADFVKEQGYKVAINSFGGTRIILPKNFDQRENDFEIGKFLEQRNEKSKKLGLDFSEFMGKEVAYATCSLMKEGKQEVGVIVFLSEKTIVGVWMFEYETENDHVLIMKNVKIL